MEYMAAPLSRVDLRRIAFRFRKDLSLENTLRFPVMLFLEHVMPLCFEGFHYEIVEKKELSPHIHAETDIVNRIIRIREDVYDGAVRGKGRDRMTIMHEIAHYLLLVQRGIKFQRVFNAQAVKKYRDPEWQAKALAGEIMCPAHLIRQLSPEQVAERCGVSLDAARFNLACKGR